MVDQDVSDLETLVILPDEHVAEDELGEERDPETPIRRQRRPRLRTSSI